MQLDILRACVQSETHVQCTETVPVFHVI